MAESSRSPHATAEKITLWSCDCHWCDEESHRVYYVPAIALEAAEARVAELEAALRPLVRRMSARRGVLAGADKDIARALAALSPTETSET